MKIEITYHFTESLKNKCTRTLDETYVCNNLNNFKKILCEFLDLPKDKNDLPIKNYTYEMFKTSVDKYVEQDFIDKEYKRIKKYYKIYDEILTNVIEMVRDSKSGSSEYYDKTLNKKTIIYINVRNF